MLCSEYAQLEHITIRVIVVVRSWGTSLGASPINLYLHYMCVQNKLNLVYSA